MASAGFVTVAAVAAVLGGYALYRSNKQKQLGGGSTDGKIKTQGYFTGLGGAFVDYKSDADARSDKRPQAAYLLKPYQILNFGAGMRPMEVDAQGAPTGRELVLPGEPSNPSSILVGRDHNFVDYQNPSDSITDRRMDRDYFIRPYQIFNPGGGIRPFEIDAHGQPTGRQLVMPGESPTAGAPGSYIMVGQGAPLASPHDQCFCHGDMDPLNPTLPTTIDGQQLYPCPCSSPNVAVHAAPGAHAAHGEFATGWDLFHNVFGVKDPFHGAHHEDVWAHHHAERESEAAHLGHEHFGREHEHEHERRRHEHEHFAGAHFGGHGGAHGGGHGHGFHGQAFGHGHGYGGWGAPAFIDPAFEVAEPYPFIDDDGGDVMTGKLPAGSYHHHHRRRRQQQQQQQQQQAMQQAAQQAAAQQAAADAASQGGDDDGGDGDDE